MLCNYNTEKRHGNLLNQAANGIGEVPTFWRKRMSTPFAPVGRWVPRGVHKKCSLPNPPVIRENHGGPASVPRWRRVPATPSRHNRGADVPQPENQASIASRPAPYNGHAPASSWRRHGGYRSLAGAREHRDNAHLCISRFGNKRASA